MAKRRKARLLFTMTNRHRGKTKTRKFNKTPEIRFNIVDENGNKLTVKNPSEIFNSSSESSSGFSVDGGAGSTDVASDGVANASTDSSSFCVSAAYTNAFCGIAVNTIANAKIYANNLLIFCILSPPCK